MDFRSVSLFSSRVFIYAVQAVIFIFCLSYIEVVYYNNILPDKQVNDDFTQTTCIVQTKELSTSGRKENHYRANFLISYMVNNVPRQAWVSGNGLDESYSHDKAEQEDALSQFEVGNSYPCWYNPNAPQMAVLVLRHDWMSTLPLLVPTVIALISFYYLVKGAFQFFGTVKLKTRERKKRYRK